MKSHIETIVKFIKNNPSVIYSLTLVLVIPVVLYIGMFFSLSQFEKRFDEITQAKALLMENVFAALIEGASFDQGYVQEKIDKIVKENRSVEEITIVTSKKETPNTFFVYASNNKQAVGSEIKDDKHALVLGNPDIGIASLEVTQGVRYWEVARLVKNGADGGAASIIKTRLSLGEVDAAFADSMMRAYIIVTITALVMVLLVTNYVRLSRYVVMFNKMKEVDQMKDDFISMASHELKTPLTAIMGYADILGTTSGPKLDQSEKRYIDNIKTSSERLRNLINDILEVSRLEQNRIPFNMQDVSAIGVVDKVTCSLAQQAVEKGLKLYVKREVETGNILVDPDRLEQVLVNLIGNAVKYTLKGEVKVRISEVEKGRLAISVEDTGLGMNARQQRQLFEKFYRIKTKDTKNITGTGLGLWITKQLVEKMNGTIDVESMENVGSRFTITFEKSDSKDNS